MDHVCDLSQIPVESGKYDLVLMTQVLEHLPEPAKVLRELYRVLKPGGTLWLSTPFYYEEHEVPYDFYRYSQYGLRHFLLLERVRGGGGLLARGLLRDPGLPVPPGGERAPVASPRGGTPREDGDSGRCAR